MIMKSKLIKKYFTTVVLGLICLNALAQQDAMFTHYMYNTLAVNPAYAGSRDALTVTGIHRSQWIGMEGAPKTQTLTMHTPINPFQMNNLGLGLSVINDQIGPLKTTSLFADFAYMLTTGEKSKLVFGLKGGGRIFTASLDDLQLENSVDEAFQGGSISKFLPNMGFGLYFHMPRFYAGISAPKLFENSISSTSNIVTNPEQRHYFMILGSVFKLSDKLDLKPSSFIKLTAAAPVEADINLTFILNKSFLFGAAYRTGDAASALIGYQISNQLLAGYSFDWSFGVTTGKYNSGSHEIMLRYDFVYRDKQKVRSPRYF